MAVGKAQSTLQAEKTLPDRVAELERRAGEQYAMLLELERRIKAMALRAGKASE